VSEFGAKFRKAREKKGISLDDVSNVTKISARMLQAIEEEKFDQLPGGVFNKGFIRAYAKHLGIDDQEAVTEYLECLRQAQIEAQAEWQPASRAAVPEKRPVAVRNRQEVKESTTQVEELAELQLPKAEHVRAPRQKYLDRDQKGILGRLPWITLVVVVLLLVIVWRRHAIKSAGESVQLPATTQAAPVVASAPTSTPTTASSPTEVQPGRNATGGAPGANKPPSSTSQTLTSQTSSTQTSAAQPSSGHSNTTTQATSAAGSENDVTNPSAETAADEPAAKPAALTLVIRATENSWVSVTADGQRVSNETLIAPAHTSVRANREIVARVGNAAGVIFLWNGKEIPAEGAEAEVKTFVFDAEGMREVTQGQNSGQNR
jgi:cytoskeleton protein RodZ